ncbi:alpha/beta hydrolase [Steroidobacter sp.]|uniref:alpha/beta hydrolase n=1 Tax=Steroidobacter sp. TaxID=1978227 RepID=UPI001A52D6D8|nr:alpha/beta hydrolase [Steroidobacter sp.]MBL8265285.1 alpha/beta hydrolase [Steroidobacter sp.]
MTGPVPSIEPRLDAEIVQMAQENRARWRIPFEEPSIGVARSAYTERYRFRSLPPKTQCRVEKLSIPSRAGAISARLYRPLQSHDAPTALIVYFHGGGFVLGDAEGYERQSMRLTEELGCAVLFPEYRLSPEHPFPAAVHDAIDVMDWVSRHAVRLSFDLQRIGVVGDSAGGNLAANVCLAARDRGGPSIALQCLLYPVTDFRPYVGGPTYPSIDAFSSGYLLDRSVMEWFTRSYLHDAGVASDPRASPILAADLSRLPSTIVVTAECDPLRDMGQAFAGRLAQAGTPVEYVCAANLAHNFMGHVASSAAARRAFDSVVEILRRRMQSGAGSTPQLV